MNTRRRSAQLRLRCWRESFGRNRVSVTGRLIPAARDLAVRLWRVAPCADSNDVPERGRKWLDVADNEWPGQLALFWIHTIQVLWHADVDGWQGLDEPTRLALSELIEGQEWTHDLAQTVIASQFHFLSSADFDWAESHVLPLFDWSRDTEAAEYAWNGYLVWGRWSQRTLPLMPFYLQCSAHEAQLGDRLDGLCQHLAAIAIYGLPDPVHSRWLLTFVHESSESLRVRWAKGMSTVLQSATSELPKLRSRSGSIGTGRTVFAGYPFH